MPLLGGVRPPIAALACLLLAVAAFTALGFETIHEQDVPQAVRDAERRIAEDAAVSVGTSIGAKATSLRHFAASPPVAAEETPTTVVKSLLRKMTSVRGGVLLDPHTGRTLAAAGEPVPLTGVDTTGLAHAGTANVPPRLAHSGTTKPRLLLFARVTVPAASGNRDENQDQAIDLVRDQAPERELLLVASEQITAPPVFGAGRTGQLVDRNGRVLAAVGTASTALAPGAGDRALPAAAASAAKAVPHTAGASGSMLGESANGLRRVAGWASISVAHGKDDTADLGLTVLTYKGVAPTRGNADHTRFALAAAVTLAVIAVLVTLLLWAAVQHPLLRLHLSAARLAKGACDTEAREGLDRPVPVPAFGEPRRAGRALESIRRQLLGEAGPETVRPVRRRPGVRPLVLVCALLVAAWGVPLMFLVNRVQAAKAIPATTVADQQARTESAADRLRQSLGQSYTDLAEVASRISGEPRGREADTLRRALAEHPKYRSLYVLDRTGAIVLRVGKRPLRTIVHAPTGDGITKVNTSGKIPAIAAYAQIPAAKSARATTTGAPAVLFAEIDVNALNSLLPRPSLGNVWLVDDHHEVLAASVGFRAFQSLPSHGLTRLAARTKSTGGTAGSPASAVLNAETAPGAGPSVAAAAPLTRFGPAAGLGWRVVSAEPAAALKLTPYQVRSHTMLAGLLALTVGVACLSWLHIVVVRPLRALTGHAERLAGGDRRTVLYPVHQDECGSVTRSLELLRQALAERDRRARPDPASPSAPSSSPDSAPQP
ncbi:HAMP domain-containing protein [Streptantibioticus rubrisoli]|uniref:Cache and HAMP domain-containing protein n=1 Tax=Streptantibioticus rubrisoli TaxID=1387313 RepID=A0ABT1PED1_9ACTN|nr:cache and HAMP domain-containing protein [Streptantibioticus rubrisoli]MCQ4043736.1 cache and HAMP domain-containing protein [Streptantibioticus rubrisoli]